MSFSEVFEKERKNIENIHVFLALTFAVARGSCLNPRPPGRGFKLLPRDTANVNA